MIRPFRGYHYFLPCGSFFAWFFFFILETLNLSLIVTVKPQIIAVTQKNNDKPKILKENNAKREGLIGKEDIDKDNPL